MSCWLLTFFFACFSAGFPPPQRLRRGVTSRFAGEELMVHRCALHIAEHLPGATAPRGVVFLCLEPAGTGEEEIG